MLGIDPALQWSPEAKMPGTQLEPSFTSQVRTLLGISPAPSAMYAYNRRLPVLSSACGSCRGSIIEHLLYILHMCFRSTHKGNYYPQFRNRGSSERRVQDRREARCQVQASDPSLYALERYLPCLRACCSPHRSGPKLRKHKET